jgi:uncharacterized protein
LGITGAAKTKVRYRSGMKLTDDSSTGIKLVRAYGPGEIRVGEETLHRSCLLRADRVVSDWRPQTLDELQPADLEAIFALDPEIVVLGSGSRQKFPPHALVARILERGIGCEVMDTGAACRTYNVLVSEDRRAVAALFVQDGPNP